MSALEKAARDLLAACECAEPEDDMFPVPMQKLRSLLNTVAEPAGARYPGEHGESKAGPGVDPTLSGSQDPHFSNAPPSPGVVAARVKKAAEAIGALGLYIDGGFLGGNDAIAAAKAALSTVQPTTGGGGDREAIARTPSPGPLSTAQRLHAYGCLRTAYEVAEFEQAPVVEVTTALLGIILDAISETGR